MTRTPRLGACMSEAFAEHSIRAIRRNYDLVGCSELRSIPTEFNRRFMRMSLSFRQRWVENKVVATTICTRPPRKNDSKK